MKKTDYPLLFLVFFIYVISFDLQAKSSLPSKALNNTTIEISKNSLQAKIEDITSREGLDPAIKAKVLSTYQTAQDNVTNIENYKSRTNEYSQAVKQATERIKKLQKELELTQVKLSKQKPEDFSKIPTEELVQRLIIEKQKISTLEEQIKKYENELTLQNKILKRVKKNLKDP